MRKKMTKTMIHLIQPESKTYLEEVDRQAMMMEVVTAALIKIEHQMIRGKRRRKPDR